MNKNPKITRAVEQTVKLARKRHMTDDEVIDCFVKKLGRMGIKDDAEVDQLVQRLFRKGTFECRTEVLRHYVTVTVKAWRHRDDEMTVELIWQDCPYTFNCKKESNGEFYDEDIEAGAYLRCFPHEEGKYRARFYEEYDDKDNLEDFFTFEVPS